MFGLTNDRRREKKGKEKAVLSYMGFDEKLGLVEKDRRWNVYIYVERAVSKNGVVYISW